MVTDRREGRRSTRGHLGFSSLSWRTPAGAHRSTTIVDTSVTRKVLPRSRWALSSGGCRLCDDDGRHSFRRPVLPR